MGSTSVSGRSPQGVALSAAPPPASLVPARWVSYVLIGCGVLILVMFVTRINLHQLAAALRGARPGLLVPAMAAVVLQVLVKAVRWRYMVRRLTGTRISMPFSSISIVAGVAAGSVAPARSFEVAKAMLLKGSHGIGLGLSTSAMLVERMLDIVFLIGALLVAALLLPHRMIMASGVLLIMITALVSGAVLLAAVPLRVRGWLRGALQPLPDAAGLRTRGLRLLDTLCESILVWRQHRTLGVLALLTALSTVLDVGRVYVVFWAMGAALPAAFLVFTYAGAAMLGMALLIPGGVGVTEVSQVGLITLLAPGAIPLVVARSAVLLDRMLSYYVLTLAGAALLLAYHRYRHVFR